MSKRIEKVCNKYDSESSESEQYYKKKQRTKSLVKKNQVISAKDKKKLSKKIQSEESQSEESEDIQFVGTQSDSEGTQSGESSSEEIKEKFNKKKKELQLSRTKRETKEKLIVATKKNIPDIDLNGNSDVRHICIVRINDDYSYGKYGEFCMIIKNSNGFMNATKLCNDANRKFRNWKLNAYANELIDEVASSAIYPADDATSSINS